MKRKQNKEDLTGIQPKNIESLFQYIKVYKNSKKNQTSFRITKQLLTSLYQKAIKLQKEGLLIITIPSDTKTNYVLRCVLTKEKSS